MRRPTRSDFLAAWLRSFAVQGSWNYRTLLGGGVAYALLPLLRRLFAGDPVALRRAVERHLASFNAHPYLTPLAVGALARLEAEEEDPRTIERFRLALRGPLGTLGDRLVWAAWRPICLSLAILAYAAGMGAWGGVLLFLLLYNGGQAALRAWALRTGWRRGLEVGRVLKGSWLVRWATAVGPLSLLLVGASALAVAAKIPGVAGGNAALGAAGAVAALLAFRWPSPGGRAAVGSLLVVPLVWWVLGG